MFILFRQTGVLRLSSFLLLVVCMVILYIPLSTTIHVTSFYLVLSLFSLTLLPDKVCPTKPFWTHLWIVSTLSLRHDSSFRNVLSLIVPVRDCGFSRTVQIHCRSTGCTNIPSRRFHLSFFIGPSLTPPRTSGDSRVTENKTPRLLHCNRVYKIFSVGPTT